MRPVFALAKSSDAYPARLRSLARPPEVLYSSRERLTAKCVVAIVGTRHPAPECARFARELATSLAQLSVVVASGGASGIDTAAHEATLAAGGDTWLVAPTGQTRVYPPENRELVDRVAASNGAVLWPFEPDARPVTFRFWLRNGVMVALADALVVIQAGIPSGTLNAAKWARKLGKPVWVVPTPPWVDGCDGSWSLLEGGARPLWSVARFLEALGGLGGLSPAREPQTVLAFDASQPQVIGKASAPPPRDFSDDEARTLDATGKTPKHVDQIASESGLPIPRLSTALLTLALEDVVVEGPSGFYCRCN